MSRDRRADCVQPCSYAVPCRADGLSAIGALLSENVRVGCAPLAGFGTVLFGWKIGKLHLFWLLRPAGAYAKAPSRYSKRKTKEQQSALLCRSPSRLFSELSAIRDGNRRGRKIGFEPNLVRDPAKRRERTDAKARAIFAHESVPPFPPGSVELHYHRYRARASKSDGSPAGILTGLRASVSSPPRSGSAASAT